MIGINRFGLVGYFSVLLGKTNAQGGDHSIPSSMETKWAWPCLIYQGK